MRTDKFLDKHNSTADKLSRLHPKSDVSESLQSTVTIVTPITINDLGVTPSSLNDDSTGTYDKKQQSDDEKECPVKDSKLAEAIAEDLKNYICFDEISLDWYQCKQGIWMPISKTKSLKVINKKLHDYLPGGFAINKLTAIEAFLKIYLSVEKWQTNRDLLPMKNGVLNVKTLALSDYSPDNRFRWQLPFEYSPNAKMDVIRHWLWEMTNKDIEAVNTLRAFIKIALTGGNLQKFLEIIGAGGTGKSTLIRLFVMLIGDSNHAATDLKNLEGNRFEAATLYGKRLAVISDSSRYGGEVSVLKALTGGDPIRLERKNQQQSGAFVFDGVVVIASNEAIQSADYTSGLARRRLPILFNVKVTDADKEKWRKHGGIESAMKAELPALLNWVLAMTEDEMAIVIGGINGDMTKAQRIHFCETNKLGAWLNDNVIVAKDAVLLIGGSMKDSKDEHEVRFDCETKLYPNYERWCKQNGVNPIAVQRFGNSLIDICEHVKIYCKRLSKSNKGARLQGLELRVDSPKHNRVRTPITLDLLNSDDECRLSDDTNPPVSLDSDGCDDSDDINSVVDFEVF